MDELISEYMDEDADLSQLTKLDEDLEYDVSDFFQENLTRLRKAVSPQSFKKFATLDRNGDRVAFILRYPEAHELPIEVVDNPETKNRVRANALKNCGNEAFAARNYELAIREYNNAALFAPRDELGVILANRSAAFYHLERFEIALRDCEQAVRVGYPKHLLHKVEERRARCLLALKAHGRAMEAFKSAIRALDDAKMPAEKRLKVDSDMRMMLAVMEKGRLLNEAETGITNERMDKIESDRLKDKDAVPRIKESNPLYPACSKAVEIRDAGGDVGRFAVATRDIQPGELLVVERPHCMVLLGEYRLTHCQRCSIRVVAPYPAACYACSSIAYCSPRCRDADEAMHRLECKMLGPFWESHASVTCMLALRAVMQRPYSEFARTVQELNRDGGRLEVTMEKPYLGKDYRAFHNLVGHEDERTAEDLFHRAYMAAWLLRILKNSSYFPPGVNTPDAPEVGLSDGERHVAGAILHHLQLLQFNCHEISEFVRRKNKKSKKASAQGKSMFVAGGVYPTVALFNHSCNPGVIRYFIGDTMVVRAVRSIPAGAEISENYGPIFTEVEEKERQRRLRLQYWFDCTCEACSKHWPLLRDIDPNVLRFKCETGPSCGNVLSVNMNTEQFMLQCSKCGKSTNLLKGLKAMQDTEPIYKRASTNLEEANYGEALKAYLEILKILDETLALPIRDYHLCQEGVRQCMLAMGNSSIV